jgi:hypothetical protein
MSKSERQRSDFPITPVEPTVGEKKAVAYKRTPGNKKSGSASRRVLIRVPQSSQSISTVVNAQRIESSMTSLDGTVAAASERMTKNLDRIQKGTMMVGAGLALMAAPVALVASTAATQKALGELAVAHSISVISDMIGLKIP